MIAPHEQLVTVFGGGGFIGRYMCEMLLKSGTRIRVAQRDPRTAHFLQPLGQVGQVGFVRADIGERRHVHAALEGATAVINLPGLLKGPFQRVHADGARNVAEAAREQGVGAVVHVSAIGADANSPSAYGRTKGEGEAAVRTAFSSATIVRPSIVFGPEDMLTNRFAGLSRLPLVPVIAPKRRFQPVYVRDLAKAIVMAALDPGRFGGKTFDIAGPQVITMREITVATLKAAGQSTEIVDLPDIAASALSWLGFLPGAPLTRDQWLMLQQDNVAAEGAPGLAAFGIDPTPLAAVAPGWLGRFGGSRFASRRVDFAAG